MAPIGSMGGRFRPLRGACGLVDEPSNARGLSRLWPACCARFITPAWDFQLEVVSARPATFNAIHPCQTGPPVVRASQHRFAVPQPSQLVA